MVGARNPTVQRTRSLSEPEPGQAGLTLASWPVQALPGGRTTVARRGPPYAETKAPASSIGPLSQCPHPYGPRQLGQWRALVRQHHCRGFSLPYSSTRSRLVGRGRDMAILAHPTGRLYGPPCSFLVRKSRCPCLPSPSQQAPSGSAWVHEIKHDGYRPIARRDGKRPTRLRLVGKVSLDS
jgi:hypothetical protein